MYAKLIKRNVSPIWAHDCCRCRFVGRLENGAEQQDLYRCPNDGALIARTGDDGGDYGSLGTMAPKGTAYALAAILARRGGAANLYLTAGGEPESRTRPRS